MTNADPTSPAVVEHYTRVIDIRRVAHARSDALIAALDKMTFSGRAGDHPLWETPSATDIHQLTQFFLPTTEQYFAGGRSTPPLHCRRVSPQWLNKRFPRVTASAVHASQPAALDRIELYVFDTGVLFLVYELSIDTPGVSLADVVEFNYLAKNRVHDQMELTPASAAGASSIDGLPQELLPAEYRSELSSLNDRSYKLQTLVRVPAGTDFVACGENLFHIRRGTKQTYERPEAGSDEGEVLRPFHNISIGITVETVCLAVSDTGHAFFKELPHRFRTAYFAHYLLALHQRAAVLAIGADVARVPCLHDGEPSSEMLRLLTDARLLITKFNLRHRFAIVSGHTNYASFYALLMQRLNLPALIDELRDKIIDADEVIRRSAASAEELRLHRIEFLKAVQDEREARRDRIFGRFLAIIGPTSLLLMLYATQFYRDGVHMKEPTGWLPLVAAVVLTVVLVWVLGAPFGLRDARPTLPLDDPNRG